MGSKEDHPAKNQDKIDKQQKDQKGLSTNTESLSQAKEEEVDRVEDFNPETADRDALLENYMELESQLTEAEDRVLRTAAEADNFKKRLQREKEEQTRYANESILRDLLPVIDNLERALDHFHAGSDEGRLAEGLNMTLKGFVDTLSRFGCTQVESKGKAFDPNFHEAVSQEETADHDTNVVLRELQKGYLLKERLLRPAMVVVSKPSSQGRDGSQKQAGDGNEKSETEKVKVKVKRR